MLESSLIFYTNVSVVKNQWWWWLVELGEVFQNIAAMPLYSESPPLTHHQLGSSACTSCWPAPGPQRTPNCAVRGASGPSVVGAAHAWSPSWGRAWTGMGCSAAAARDGPPRSRTSWRPPRLGGVFLSRVWVSSCLTALELCLVKWG